MVVFRNAGEKIIYAGDQRKFDEIKQYIGHTDSVLKVGAGLGFQIDMIREHTLGTVEVVEIEQKTHVDIQFPVTIYDGKTLPFSDKFFDVSIATHVLHHTSDPSIVLSEMMRVSHKVIIVEEIWSIWPQRISIILNCWFKGVRVGEWRQKLYFSSYLSEKNWLKLFQQLGIIVEVEKKIWRYKKLYPFQVAFYVLYERKKTGRYKAKK